MSMYVRVQRRIWNMPAFRELTEDARILYLYLWSCPHGNMLGIFILRPGYIQNDMGWTEKRVEKAFDELCSKPLPEPLPEPFRNRFETVDRTLFKTLVLRCPTTDIVVLCDYLDSNPLDNPNQVKAAIKILDELPACELFQYVINRFETVSKPFTKPLWERLRERLREPFAKPVTVTVTVTEKKTRARATPEPSLPQKLSISEFVFLTEDEITKLKTKFGSNYDLIIEKLNNYKAATGKQYKSDYHAILNWVAEEVISKPQKTEVYKQEARAPTRVPGPLEPVVCAACGKKSVVPAHMYDNGKPKCGECWGKGGRCATNENG